MGQTTSKELEYVIDSMSNEDMLMKSSAQAAAISTHPEVKQVLNQMPQTHLNHYNTLLNDLKGKPSSNSTH